MTATDHRHALFSSYEHAARVVEEVDASQLRLPTVCPDYDVAGLVDHIVGAGSRAAALGRGESPDGEEFPHVELTEAPDRLRRAGKEAEAAWSDDASLTRTVTMPWGEVYSGATLVDMYLAELACHAWDLAAATGRLGVLDDSLAPVALEAARAMLKPEYRNIAGEGSPFGSEVEAPDGASSWEQLVAFMGRPPRPRSS